jgi:HlyD family secretion protein
MVTTGLDDKTEVQVISGLQEGEEVITGYKKVQKKETTAAQTDKSPFMPTRGGGNRKKPG